MWLLSFYSNYPLNVENDRDKNVGTNNDRKTLEHLSAVYLSFVDRGLLTKKLDPSRNLFVADNPDSPSYIHYDHHKSNMR